LLHLDTFSGIAGNMFLGALLDAGLPRRALSEDLAGLRLPHTLRVSTVRRGALAARYVKVGLPRGARQPHRSYGTICKLLDRARLRAPVRDRAQAIFAALAEAEARVHGIPVERVHFHEVGAVDAIVDVVGAASALDRLQVRRVTATPPALGHGQVETEHGLLPLPAPATLELLRGVPTVPAHVAWETVTPTGAAILRTVVDEFRTLPALTIEAVGHGAGNDRKGPMPNVLRAVLGTESGLSFDRVVALEANLDDLVPEHFDHVMERCFEAGALDVSLQHAQMKKNRPGFLLRVLVRPQQRLALTGLLVAETSTLGVRAVECDRLVLEREVRSVRTGFGNVRVKRALREDGSPSYSAEYDDCKRAAARHSVPLRDVIREAEQMARDAF
jgi:uncharacterized protein (TIGR00299 family) protein